MKELEQRIELLELLNEDAKKVRELKDEFNAGLILGMIIAGFLAFSLWLCYCCWI